MSSAVPESAQRPTLGIDQYWYVAKRQWRVLVAAAILGVLIAGGYLAITPSIYTATTDVRPNVISADPFSTSRAASTLLDGTAETQIASSYVVAEKAAESLGGSSSAATLHRGSSITASTGATIVHASYAAPSETEARAGADAIAQAYLDYRSAQARKTIDSRVKQIDDSLAGLNKQLAEANANVASARADSTAAVQATSDRNLIVTEMSTLYTQRSGFAQIDTSGGSILTSATKNDISESPKISLVLASGLLAGGVLGLILAFPINAFDRKFRNTREVQRAIGPGVLATVTPIIAALPEKGVALDALEVAAERLLPQLNPRIQTISIIDDSPDPEGSDIPINLALVMAKQGHKIRLVVMGYSTDRHARLRERLDLVRLPADKSGTVFRCHLASKLTVYLASKPDDDSEPGSRVSQQVTDQAGIATPDTLTLLVLPARSSEASRLAAERISDAAILVVATKSSRSDHIEAVISELSSMGKQFLGIITVPGQRSLPLVGAAAEA